MWNLTVLSLDSRLFRTLDQDGVLFSCCLAFLTHQLLTGLFTSEHFSTRLDLAFTHCLHGLDDGTGRHTPVVNQLGSEPDTGLNLAFLLS